MSTILSLYSLVGDAVIANAADAIERSMLKGIVERRDMGSLFVIGDYRLSRLVARGHLAEPVDPTEADLFPTGVIHRRLRYNPGGKIDGARLARYDPDTQSVTVRVDDSRVLQAYLSIELPLGTLCTWIQTILETGEEPLFACRGRLCEIEYSLGGTGSTVRYNTGGSVDGARLHRFDPESHTVTIRVDDTRIMSAWTEIELPLRQLYRWLTETEENDGLEVPASVLEALQ